jgi:hypothetical protein
LAWLEPGAALPGLPEYGGGTHDRAIPVSTQDGVLVPWYGDHHDNRASGTRCRTPETDAADTGLPVDFFMNHIVEVGMAHASKQ